MTHQTHHQDRSLYPDQELDQGISYARQASVSFGDFVDTIAALRRPDGCPWDREQTHQSIAPNMIEEAYEAVDAIEKGDNAHLREELGDVLLQVVLQSQIAADAGEFSIDDVCRDVNDKIIRRHPHVFGDAKAQDAGEVLDLWDQVKLEEKQAKAIQDETNAMCSDKNASLISQGLPEHKQASPKRPQGSLELPQTAQGHSQKEQNHSQRPREQSQSILDDVPSAFPALLQAQKISRKAVSVGFEWDSLDHVWNKVDEEIDELKEAYANVSKLSNGKIDKQDPLSHDVELELGDVLFTLVNVARTMGVNAEEALRATCVKFRSRWANMEEQAWRQNSNLAELDMDELQVLWDRAKQADQADIGANINQSSRIRDLHTGSLLTHP